MRIRVAFARARGFLRRTPFLVRLAIWCLIVYLGVALVFAQLQRSLIYLPTRAPRIEPSDAELPPGQVHTITLTTHDGLSLRGWHLLADGQTATTTEECDRQLMARRLALFFSGNAANRRYRTDECRLLTGLGINVFLFDYRGYGENPGAPSEELLAADARAIWEYATLQRGVSADQIVLYGESLGGGVAVRLAAELCQANTIPGALVLRSTYSSLVDVASYHYPWLPVRLALTERYPSVERAPQVRCPVLQIHGREDSIVPLVLGEKLFDAIPAVSDNGICKCFLALSSADHNDILWVAANEMHTALSRFFASLPETESR